MHDLYHELINLAESDNYPFHMPGHKRNTMSTPFEGAFRCDITEIDGFDNLHDESGLILDAEKRANKLYGAKETFFLVNGSTCGVLSAVSAAVPMGGTILAARGSHKALYHAAYIRNLDIKYLPYKINSKFEIPEAYTAEDVRPYLSKDIAAVFITSPTYEGKSSDIAEISKLCHENNIPLIVDAAHGAHFGFGNTNNTDKKEKSSTDYTFVPESAVTQGADIVIHSVHKTLPSMTQTALIHINGELIDKELVKRYLRIYQSSSPSYILMASIEQCMEEMEKNGTEYIDKLLNYRNYISEETSALKNIYIPGPDEIDDPCKVLITDASGTMTGQQIYDILRTEYALQLEMAGTRTALAIITGSDTKEGIERLIKALKNIDKKIEEAKKSNIDGKSGNLFENSNIAEIVRIRDIPPYKMKLSKAWDAKSEVVSIDKACGRISAEFINLYPPGIPIIVPGEVLTEEIVSEIKNCNDKNLNLQGIINIDKKQGAEIGVKVIVDF
ncbi:aminotransferase class I/II-fold pyridoxal phosphate-dependent enzyme [Butyrivibrio sp. XB500-5]|uniref:aminotransferase class I/II-fold pyridoxal phosphate-dependent enzyme n=1 Tax=Butyrivibrio sp. XB500-5 TaxID=2364880 RepID=UPI000EA8ADF7|nr:aminotransferase class I/II-fold pyridoxal phosphate-dependent enzyme [Butyrivibrio sp. XB500-5]RKM57781.1 aminotransferase class I/II-fold pyridoxal phosphate-dependent enzyme [Butyrivibrio sp. XB500-5]